MEKMRNNIAGKYRNNICEEIQLCRMKKNNDKIGKT